VALDERLKILVPEPLALFVLRELPELPERYSVELVVGGGGRAGLDLAEVVEEQEVRGAVDGVGRDAVGGD